MRRRLRWLVIASLAAALALVAAACGDDDTTASSSTQATTATTRATTTTTAAAATTATTAAPMGVQTLEAGILTVGSDIPFPPFEDFDAAGNVVGFDAALVNEMASRLGLEVVWLDVPFDTIFTQLATGAFDVVASATTITPTRAEQVNFTQPYYNAQQALTVNVDETPNLRSTSQLGDGDSVAVQAGTTGRDWAIENLTPQGVEVREFPEAPDTYNALEAGQVTGVIFDEPSAVEESKNRPSLEVVEAISTNELYGFGVDPANPDLLVALNDALDGMIDDGTYQQNYNEWFEAPAGSINFTAPPPPPPVEPPPAAFQSDIGVTAEPCPGSVNPDNGCIFLGAITDTSGPFAALGPDVTQGGVDFWDAVNAVGGLNGFDVVITADNTINAMYDPAETVAAYQRSAGNVAAYAQILGTPQSLAVFQQGDIIANNSVVMPATWYSGWGFTSVDNGQVFESGAPYCFEAMNATEFVTQNFGTEVAYGIVAFPGDYGGDYRAGVLEAATFLGMPEPLFDIQQIPVSVGGDVTEVVGAIVQTGARWVFVTTGPTELAQIIGGTFQAVGGDLAKMPMFMGAVPTFNKGLFATPVWDLMKGFYYQSSPFKYLFHPDNSVGQTVLAQTGRNPTPAWGAGFMWQYPMLAILDAAIESGDITHTGGGILAAAQGVTVDYEGSLPNRTYGDPDATVERGTIIHKPDPDLTAVDDPNSDGLVDGSTFFVGRAAAARDHNAPCLALG